VTVPSPASIEADHDGANWSIKGLLSRYSVREVTLRRWVPARMRD